MFDQIIISLSAEPVCWCQWCLFYWNVTTSCLRLLAPVCPGRPREIRQAQTRIHSSLDRLVYWTQHPAVSSLLPEWGHSSHLRFSNFFTLECFRLSSSLVFLEVFVRFVVKCQAEVLRYCSSLWYWRKLETNKVIYSCRLAHCPVLTCCGSTYPSSSQQAETDWRQPFVGSRNTLRRDQIKTNLLTALALHNPKGLWCLTKIVIPMSTTHWWNRLKDSFTLFVWFWCARNSLSLSSFYFSFDLKLFMSCWDLITTQLYPSYVDMTLSWTWTSRSPQQSSIRNIL